MRTNARDRWLAGVICLLAGAGPLRAQTPDHAAPDGWTSTWTQPMTPQERAHADFQQRFDAAVKGGRLQGLETECERAARAAPDDVAARGRLALVHAAMKRYDDAMDDLRQASDIARRTHRPDRIEAEIHFQMSRLDILRGRYADEADELELAVKTDRTLPIALNNLAWLRATNPDPALRNGREAVALARDAVKIASEHAVYQDTLAAAYAETGDFARACALEKEATATAIKEAAHSERAAAFLKTRAPARLDLYMHNQPYRETPHAPAS